MRPLRNQNCFIALSIARNRETANKVRPPLRSAPSLIPSVCKILSKTLSHTFSLFDYLQQNSIYMSSIFRGTGFGQLRLIKNKAYVESLMLS